MGNLEGGITPGLFVDTRRGVALLEQGLLAGDAYGSLTGIFLPADREEYAAEAGDIAGTLDTPVFLGWARFYWRSEPDASGQEQARQFGDAVVSLSRMMPARAMQVLLRPWDERGPLSLHYDEKAFVHAPPRQDGY